MIFSSKSVVRSFKMVGLQNCVTAIHLSYSFWTIEMFYTENYDSSIFHLTKTIYTYVMYLIRSKAYRFSQVVTDIVHLTLDYLFVVWSILIYTSLYIHENIETQLLLKSNLLSCTLHYSVFVYIISIVQLTPERMLLLANGL